MLPTVRAVTTADGSRRLRRCSVLYPLYRRPSNRSSTARNKRLLTASSSPSSCSPSATAPTRLQTRPHHCYPKAALLALSAAVWYYTTTTDDDNEQARPLLVLPSSSFHRGTIITTTCEAKPNAPLEASFQISDHYTLEKILGQGAYGVVVQARRKSDHRLVALKTMNRAATDPHEFRREVRALQRLSSQAHPHICQLVDLHSDSKNYYLAMEIIHGLELFEHLIQNGAYSEGEAATFVRQHAEALDFMHTTAGVVHGDLKPENLMMSDTADEQQQLKVVDFGCAVLLEDDKQSEEQSEDIHKSAIGGTTAYWSPELVLAATTPTPASDMWATGCICYILLTGTHPFDKYGTATDEEIEDLICQVGGGRKTPSHGMTVLKELVFDERMDGLSDSCVELLKGLMHPDPQKRMTSRAFLCHPWVQGLTASWRNTMQDTHRKLEAFWQRRFRMEVLKKYGSSETLSDRNLAEIFRCMDLNGDGLIQPEELEEAFRDLGVQQEDAYKIFRSVDLDGSGAIDLDEFKAIMRQAFDDGPDVRVYHRQLRFGNDIYHKFANGQSEGINDELSEEALREIFYSIDLDGNGVLDPHEIRVVLRTAGEDEESISQIVASIDLNQDGGVSWDEFLEIMRLHTSSLESESMEV